MRAEEEAQEVALMNQVVEVDPKIDKEAKQREQQEQLELCGESFLEEIHKMI